MFHTERQITLHFSKRDMNILLYVFSCICEFQYLCCAFMCFVFFFAFTRILMCGFENFSVTVSMCGGAGEVWRRLAAFMLAYGPWVWDSEGAGTEARPLLVGGGDVCVRGCDLGLIGPITQSQTNLLLNMLKLDSGQLQYVDVTQRRNMSRVKALILVAACLLTIMWCRLCHPLKLKGV